MRFHFKRRSSRQERKRQACGWSPAQRWLATGTLAFYTVAGSGRVALAQQSGDITKASPGSAPNLPVVRFDIPKGSLEDAVAAFINATGLHVEFSQDALATLATEGLSGLYTAQSGLKMLLTNTGLSYRFTSANTVVIEISKVTASIEVVDAASALATSSAKYSEPLRDTPQTIDVVSQKTMQEQGVTTLRDGLRNVAGISIAAGEGGSQGDNLTIRGFSARNDLYIDGMRDFGSYYRDPFNLDEIEVIQGPESTNFGRGSTGGVVNQATKIPNMNRMFSGAFDGGTDGTRRLTTDFNVPFYDAGHCPPLSAST